MITIKKIVPVIITGDIDFSKHHYHDGKIESFENLLKVSDDIGIKMTYFFTAAEAEQVGSYPRRFVISGHEIGCHGLTHGEEEEYDSMPHEMQKEYLRKATAILSSLSEQEIVSFRGPRVKVSAGTYELLAEMGYKADSSVCAQRIDLVSSNMLNVGWITCPRLPYHPSRKSVYRKGDIDIIVVPISALLLPFISSTLYVFGLEFMKLMFRVLYLESLLTGKPVVYLFHPYEFAGEIPGAKEYNKNMKVHGLRVRRHFYRGSPVEKLEQNKKLWSYMKSFDRVQFMTTGQFAGSAG